jgi:ABC-type Fe3+-hydroxamate transport system substrate-binding protein
MAAGNDTFINDMLARCGFENVVDIERYPELSEADLIHLDPELILFSSEPYPFKEQHMEQLQKLLPHTHMQLVNGEPFSWYGSRLLESANYFKKLKAVLNL